MSQKHGPVAVIDGHNTFIRNYVRSPYLDTNGNRAGGTTGMVISVRKIITDLRASNCLVVWDGEGGSQRRKSIYSEYKAGRTVRLNEKAEYDFGETPEQRMENMRHQRNQAQEYLTMLGIPQVRCDGVEADDVMAYVSTIDFPGGLVIVTTDQDLLQLVREKGRCSEEDHTLGCTERCSTRSEVRVWSPVKKVMYDRARFISDYGILPENFRIMKALTGDSSDNIEGIKGFGAKTVAKTFPSLAERRVTADEVLAAAEGLKGVVGKRLIEQKSRFLENLRLVDLSDPMLSATAARQSREALVRDLGFHEVDLRLRLVRDGVTFSGDGFGIPFRDFAMRRRRLLAETPRDTVIDAEISTENVQVVATEEIKTDE